jgi:hypothetical protein
MSRARALRSYTGVVVLALGVAAGLFVASRLSRILFERPALPHASVALPAAVAPAPVAAPPPVDASLFQVVTAEGGVEAYREGKWIAIQHGDLLTASDVVRTVPGARAVLKVGESTEIELRENVEIRLDRLSGTETSVNLRQGKLVARVGRPGNNLAITASDTRTSNDGPAHFIVMATEGGKVAVASTQGNARFTAAGKEVLIPPGKTSHAAPGAPPADPEEIPEDVILSVVWPDAEKHAAHVPVSGTAGTASVVKVNGERVAVEADGRFAASIALHKGENVVKVETEDLTGRTKASSTTLVREPTRRPKLAPEQKDLWDK